MYHIHRPSERVTLNNRKDCTISKSLAHASMHRPSHEAVTIKKLKNYGRVSRWRSYARNSVNLVAASPPWNLASVGRRRSEDGEALDQKLHLVSVKAIRKDEH